MCNLYSLRSGADALRHFFDAKANGEIGNLGDLSAIFPDQRAPIVRMVDGHRTLAMMRWGFPRPGPGAGTVTNVRESDKPFWSRWLGPKHRCVVPFTAFSEYEDTKPRKTPVWFARDEGRPVACFAGIWRPHHGVRGTKAENPDREAADHLVYAFLTTEANAEVKAIHPKAMPVVLTEPDEIETWLSAPWAEAKVLQRPLSDSALQIVARGSKRDGVES